MARAPINLKASLERVRQGGIPLRAEERLAEERGPDRRLFTSDLTVSEFLLARDADCHPISQVMGSCIYHVGQIPDYKGRTGEITVISEGHRESRRAALNRLFQEATLLGADAVIGVHLRDRMITMGARGKGGDDGGEVLEFTVVGTAVRAPWITHPPGQPIITDLSGQELWALAQDGFEPCGFLFEFCRYHVWHVTGGVGPGVLELEAASRAVDQARAIAAQKLQAQAAQLGAAYVVGSDIDVEVREVPCGFGGCPLDDLDVDVSWFGTGVRRIPQREAMRAHSIPPLILSMIPLGRRDDVVIDAEDDADDVEVAAEEAEEAALEADEAAGGE
ncbi:MAG TPA: heavy metal-binding domain-containing protein [Kofleriaceae bacterium]|nr:heavy metal-binding domain-containing protein [Kofleriaceae bacterium]